MSDNQPAFLHVCVTCRGADADEALNDGDGLAPRPGQQLLEAVGEALGSAEARVRLEPVVCLANCSRGCSAVLSSPGKWAYMVGHLTPELADDLACYARAYAVSDRGVVLRKDRPESMRHAILGRFPAIVSNPIGSEENPTEAAE